MSKVPQRKTTETLAEEKRSIWTRARENNKALTLFQILVEEIMNNATSGHKEAQRCLAMSPRQPTRTVEAGGDLVEVSGPRWIRKV